ncbi:MAG: 1-deoxy-D-xylulose-5-phosphate reductoisomerase [Hoeflea sp.]|uniref:1-deoxy-D-xylulose-5-phosphate reductoisomerase n=1 Tax=Hoeflea sp. TaxID=1940281 RepID=UPI001DF18CA3|nr:1-deoxy-D-xylulose-5-phosphate reductoisomerase [Hoeflea sp.]MBU4528611.1 1-deoxy-D-xylulose-5-phosphate reductoisomerase [Alphaproteobacteria bacterium]MBU4545584.1 1-deoxy-D-xylulose-5-phosphate reductoisomerase [Alphaproteobacteria bacterium]MBU4552194.1 1-deoxy-D-xylulose-5-phosphate reductoisomerase [Alphaproteobacteria bacterium]MBV1726214.1 1-deoxy-D-xylulose-5-phosphate reductoisomerase [Hoeflea sp.]MBV1762359.1 1-deoxy-D-xylulose-5-phosphate reductoisomerase [Hoeflea sp.]
MNSAAFATKRRISILGSTGSIGRNTLDVMEHLGGRDAFAVPAITGMGNIELLARQARQTGAGFAATADPDRYAELKSALAGSGIEVGAGPSALIEAGHRDTDLLLAGIVGIAGLAPTLAAVAGGADIALANKECLVSAGDLFTAAMSRGGGRLLPVDSEHNAIFQVLEENQRHAVERIILTASGGPFRDYTREQMAAVTPEIAAAHPNWSMGIKISIDSASMFNKALEMIEARHLFGLRPDQIEVIVHPQSIIHSMVGYSDGSVLAQLGAPDMRHAIGYAISHPRRANLPVERLDFARLARLDFSAPDETRFPALALARIAMQRGGLQGAILNGAKEAALDVFIAGRTGFLDMADIVAETMDRLHDGREAASIEDVYAADREARAVARSLLREPA